MWGRRCEYYKPCLKDKVAFDALYDVAQRLAKTEIPHAIRDGLLFSSLTALLKPNTRLRGISSDDTFRRLVAKTLARQFQTPLREAVWPRNFGI
eukprot:8534538-Pyramimonas_sp.AAC.1